MGKLTVKLSLNGFRLSLKRHMYAVNAFLILTFCAYSLICK